MIVMDNWIVRVPPESRYLGYEGENAVSRFAVILGEGEYSGWAFKLDIRAAGGATAIFDLTAGDGEIYFDLADENRLPKGEYAAQVRGLRGEQVEKSNIFHVIVREAINAFEVMPPSEFAQMEQRVTALKEQTEAAAKGVPEAAVQAAAAAEESKNAAARAEEAARALEDAAGKLDLKPTTKTSLGGMIVGDNLTVDESGRVSVDTASAVDEDNTKPITAAAVHTTVGNINILLSLI